MNFWLRAEPALTSRDFVGGAGAFLPRCENHYSRRSRRVGERDRWAEGAGHSLHGGDRAEPAEAFLEGRITFGDISETVAEACGAIEPTPARTLADVRTADEASRAFVRSRFGARIGSD